VLKEGTPPPMLFDDLKEKLLDECIRPDVEKLLELKKSAPEIGESEPFKRLNDYLADKISEMERILSEMPEDRNSDWETLNSIFLKLT
jgi:predicted nucleotidyltransferase